MLNFRNEEVKVFSIKITILILTQHIFKVKMFHPSKKYLKCIYDMEQHDKIQTFAH